VSSSYWRPAHDFRMNLAKLDDLYADCNTRANIAISTYGATENTGRQVLRISYEEADHGFDSKSQTWPSGSCTWPSTTYDADTCAMRGADINSWIFFRDRLLNVP
jgi:hypothetical protein